MRATIFNIQKFNLHDGPGIRTVVFFKGCPLRCLWCANPESQSFRPQIARDWGKCVRCGACEKACPRAAIDENTYRADKCVACGACVAACWAGALTLEGESRALDDVLTVCMQDLPFYEESGGGVTLSGGEVLSQPDFACALIDALREKNIHTAVQTSGFSTPETFDRVCGRADLILFDMKHWDEARHVAGTGVSNRPILENMRRAAASKRDLLVRIPVIPGYNDSPEDAARFSSILASFGIRRAQLLPFHQFGESKYERLGIDYVYRAVPALRVDALGPYRAAFQVHGVETFV